MDRGFMYITFGEAYDYLAAHSAAYTRKFSAFPIQVVTNVRENLRSKAWRNVKDVTFTYVDMPTDSNRVVKTNPLAYSIFERTFYLDCDTVIRHKSYEQAFRILEVCDVAYPVVTTYSAEGPCRRIYCWAMRQFGATLPLVIYHGGLCAFKRNERTARFFETWQRFWREFNHGRDMPPLACAAQLCQGVSVGILPKGFGEREGTIIAHVSEKIPQKWLPQITRNKSFDRDEFWDWIPLGDMEKA